MTRRILWIFVTSVILIFVTSVILTSALLGAPEPEWVRERPVLSQYYVGIGVATKEGNSRDYIQQAKDAALSDLSSEISVNISSELVDIAIEQSGLSEEQVRREIRMSTQEELEDFEMVDTWESDREYWVYYRLSKSIYAAKKQARLENATTLARDLFLNGERARSDNDYAAALRYYFQAYQPIRKYFADPIQVEIDGENIYLKNALYTSIQSTLSQIELIPENAQVSAKAGRALPNPLGVKAVFYDQQNQQHMVPNLPLSFKFIRGEGALVENNATDNRGEARCRISAITAPDQLQIVRVRLDMDKLISQDSTNTLLQGIVSSLSTPETRIILNVSGLSFFIQGSEQNFGAEMEVAYVDPLLKNILSEKGYSFTEDLTQADFIIEFQAQTRKGDVMYGQHVAYVDMNISVIDLQSGDEIYKQAFQNVRGIHLDFDRAGLKAYENVGQELTEEFMPALLSKIQS